MSVCVLLILGSLIGAQGTPGLSGRSFPKSVLFPDRFFNGFLMVLASMLDDLFDDFPMFFASLIRDVFHVFLKFSESNFEPCEP